MDPCSSNPCFFRGQLYLGNSLRLAECLSLWNGLSICSPAYLIGLLWHPHKIMQVEMCWALEVRCKCQEFLWLQDADLRARGLWTGGEPQHGPWGYPGVSACSYQVAGVWSVQLGSVLQEAWGLPGTSEGCRRWGPVLAQVQILFRVTLTCWAFCLPAFSCTGHLDSGWAVLSALVRSCSGRSVGPLGLFLAHPLSQTQPRRGRHWEPSGLSPEFLCGWISSYPRTATSP